MTALENILSQEIIQKLGWTLIHFVWQAAVVALVLAIVLRLLRKSSANLRYMLACLALTLMVLLPVMTIRTVSVSAADTVTTQGPVAESAIDVTEGIPIAEMAVIETPAQGDSAAAVPGISWRQRAASVIEPALPYIVAGWLMGVLGLSVWHLGGWTQLQRLRRRMVKPVNASLHSKLRELAGLLGINRAVELAESALVGVPTVVGWLKPMILLPASALTGLSGEQLEAILAHELAHIKRGDYLVNILQTVVEILGFYHPAVWWVSHKIRVERENCCDDLAVSISGDRIRYARALTSMAEIRAGYGLAVAATGGSLFERIRRLVGKDTAGNSRSNWAPSSIAIMLIMSLLIPISFAMSSRAKTDTESTVEKVDYASVIVKEGVGFDDIVVGDANCTMEFIKSMLGGPDEDLKDTETNEGWWLNYRRQYGIDFWFDKNKVLKEIRFNQGFKGNLQSGISMSSNKDDVFRVYGEPIAEELVSNLNERVGTKLVHTKNQILYKHGSWKPEISKIYYHKHWLLFWFKGNKIIQFVTFPKKQKPDVQAGFEESAASLRVEELEKRVESAQKLQKLGKALIIYGNENQGKYPDSLKEIKSYLQDEQDLAWLLENVEYPGKGKSLMISPQAVIAYDKTFLEKGKGTNVLYNDCHVAFEKPKQLEKLGIKTKEQSQKHDVPVAFEKPKQLEKLGIKTKEQSQKPDMRVADDAKAEIQVNTRLLLVPIDANEFNNFFEDESLEAASVNINDDPNLQSYFLSDKQTDQLLKLANTTHGSKTLAAPKVIVNDGEEASLRTHRTIRYTIAADNSGQPEVKEVPVGTVIVVKPTLQAGGEKILLELDFEHTHLVGFIDGLPKTEIVRIKSNVSVPNGSTLLLGGQKMTDQQDGQEVLKTLLCLVKAEKL